MFLEHYPALVLAYLAGLGGWLLVSHQLPEVWPSNRVKRFDHPWSEIGFALLGLVGILIVGQLWMSGVRLPEHGALGPVMASLNQVLIFAPILLVLKIRRQPWTSAWFPTEKILTRFLVGMGLAFIVISAYSLLREESDGPWVLFSRIWRYDNIDKMTQVFLEDIAIAILFVRFAGAIGSRWAIAVVASLFAASHIPAMVSQGVSLIELAGLLADAGLGFAVIYIWHRSQDVVWFWCIHFSLDMTQFASISGAP